MTPEAAATAITRAGARLGLDPSSAGPVRIERPRPGGHGDYACGVALGRAGADAAARRELAGRLARALAADAEVAGALTSVEVSGPGFLDLTLTPAARVAVLGGLIDSAAAYAGVGTLAVGSDPFAPATTARLGCDVAAYARAAGHLGAHLSAGGGAPTGSLAVMSRPEWRRASDDNPAYRVQRAHARTRDLARGARALALQLGAADRGDALVDPSPLFTTVAGWSTTARRALTRRDPRLVTRHLERLSDELDTLLASRPALPVGPQAATEDHRARLLLVAAAGAVLAAGLHLLGVRAPERM